MTYGISPDTERQILEAHVAHRDNAFHTKLKTLRTKLSEADILADAVRSCALFQEDEDHYQNTRDLSWRVNTALAMVEIMLDEIAVRS